MNNNFRGNNGGRRPWNRQKRGSRGFWDGGGMPSRRGNNFSRNFSVERAGNQQYGNNRQYKRDMPTKRLTEEEIGVTEYISKHKGFNGIIKSRFSDFQVSEINEEGEVAKLTDTTPPPVPRDEAVAEDEDLLLNKYNLEILPMETWDKINQLVLDASTSGDKVEIDVTGMSKDHRTKIHEAVKKAFGDSVVGSTVTIDEKKYVKFEKYRKGIRIDNRVKWVWPEEYVYFILYKENCDTMEAASRLAERLRMNIKPSMIGYAGTKDRRAKTAQWMSVRRVDPRRVASACEGLRPLRAGNYSFHSGPLKLGMLKGNRFRICLRNVTALDGAVDEACALLRDNGFINYYGLQRFGSRADVPTYLIGQKLLQGKFKEAIDLILHGRAGPLCACLRLYHECDAGAALRALPAWAARAHPVETRLLRALAQRPNDLLGALALVSRNSRLLYLHAYQSLLWNRAASHRLRRARTVLPGDLVPDTTTAGAYEEFEEDSENEDENDNTDNIDTEVQKEDKTEEKDKEKKKYIKQPKELIKVKALTQEDVDNGSYTISDIVLPLPGYKVTYPPNMKEFYEEELQKDGLKLDMVHKYKSYSLSGGYRGVVVRPGEFTWSTVHYRQPHADLLLSDADHLDGEHTTSEEPDGPYKALLVTMDLPSSCYATMALRELLRVDTSSESQAQLNNYHMDTDKQTDKETENSERLNGDGEKRKLDGDNEVDSKKVKAN